MSYMSPEEEHRSAQKLIYSLKDVSENIIQYYNQVLAMCYFVIHVTLNE